MPQKLNGEIIIMRGGWNPETLDELPKPTLPIYRKTSKITFPKTQGLISAFWVCFTTNTIVALKKTVIKVFSKLGRGYRRNKSEIMMGP